MKNSLNEVRIGFLVKTYPKLSETFILGEILGLEEKSLRISVYSTQRPTDELIHADIARVKAPVSYLPESLGDRLPETVLAHLRVFACHPLRYLATLCSVVVHRETQGGWNFIRAGWLAARLGKDGVAHLHAHFACIPAAIAELTKRLSGISYSISAHAKDIYLSEPRSLARRLAGATFTVTCTEHNREYLASLAPAGARVYRMYHGIDARQFSPSASQSAATPVLLSVGRLREKKGLDVLVEACARLRDTGRDFQCRIIGYGPEEQRLREQVERAGLSDRVRLLGKLTRDEVIEHYRQATAFVLPCRVLADGDRDGIPNVLLEAMAMELPVVSTSVSGIPEAVAHERNGLLVPPGDAAAIAAAVQRILDDPLLAGGLGRAGRATVLEHFSTRNLQLLMRLFPCRSEQGLLSLQGELGVAKEFNG